MLKTIMIFGGGAATALGAIAAVWAMSVHEETPEVNNAEAFLRSYFATAPSDPHASWQRLTPGYIQEREANPNDPKNPFNFASYARYFASYRTISVTNVHPSEQFAGWFAADVTYQQNGKSDSTSHQVFQLTCPDSTKFPFIRCDEKTMQINRVILDKGLAEQEPAKGEPGDACPKVGNTCETFVDVTANALSAAGQDGHISLHVSNSGDYPTLRCALREADGHLQHISLQPGMEKELDVLLEPHVTPRPSVDPSLTPSAGSTAGAAPTPSAVPSGGLAGSVRASLDFRCANVRNLPRSVAVGPPAS